MKLENFYPTAKDFLCSDHFENDCFMPNGKRKTLRKKLHAVPTIFTGKFVKNINVIFQNSFTHNYFTLTTKLQSVFFAILHKSSVSFFAKVEVILELLS